MPKHFIVVFIIVFFFGHLMSQGSEVVDVTVDYNGWQFERFVGEIEKKKNVQFYYFPGWVADIKIKQEASPTTLDVVLTRTFAGSDYNYYINSHNQVIITIGKNLSEEFQIIDSAEAVFDSLLSTQNSISKFSEANEEYFDTDWIVMGDPLSPEQRPEVTINGYVSNRDTGEPIDGAILYVKELKTGTTTDSLGYYEMKMRQGRYEVVFQSIGLKDGVKKVQLYESGRLDVGLNALALNIEEVVVRAERKDNVSNVQMGVEVLKIETVKSLPALLGEVDIVRSALLLPGVQSAGEFSSGINVRGGGADQNLILLNGAPVFNATHLFGFSSSFSPDIVEGFELYKSSIPVKFGGRISSVLQIDMKEGDGEKWSLKGGISPITSRLTVEGPLNQRTSLIASGRATYSDWILGRIQNTAFRNSKANYQDVTVKLKSYIGQNDHIDVSAYVSNDRFRLNGDTTFAYQNLNVIATYQHSFSDQLFGNFSLLHTQYNFNVDSEEKPLTSFDLSYKIDYSEAKSHFSFAAHDNHQLNFGLNLVNYKLSPGSIEPKLSESIIEPIDIEKERALEGSLYFSDQWSISEPLSIYAGLRYTSYWYLGPRTISNYAEDLARIERNIIGTTRFDNGELIKQYSGPEYRLSLRYALNSNTSIKASFNRTRQYLSMLFNSATISPTATWKLSDSHILPQTGDQFSVGIFRNMSNDDLELSVEGYYKKIQNMVEYKAGAELLLNEHIEADIVNGEGRAYGLEVLLKKNGKKLNGWISYTFSKTRFRATSPFLLDRINQGEWFPTNFDKPHDFSLVGNLKISRRFSISSNVTYSTGRPVTVPVAKYLFANGTRLQYSRRNEFRVPNQFRWDLSINVEGNHKKNKLAHSSWSLSVYNLTGRKNAYSVYFVSDGIDAKGYQLSIFGRPIVTLTYNFKI